MYAISVVFAISASAAKEPLYLKLDTPSAPELSPAEALRHFTLAPGFEIELVVAEPLVEDPVAITWDESGNLYVAEMRGFMPDAYGNHQNDPVGAVVRLRDTDGDGRYETREVLLDQLVLPRAIAIVNEGLLVGEPPNLWLCPSDSGRAEDIDCGAKRSLGPYGDQPGSVEHAENGLLTGLDNWLYSAKSNRRLRLDQGAMTSEPTLFRGQWGIAQDNDGRLFYNTNSNLLLGDAFDAQQVVLAGNASAPGLGERVSHDDQLFAVRVNPGVNRAYVPGVLREDGRLNRPTSASGMTVYRGDQFPLSERPRVFVTEPAANAVAQLQLDRDGLDLRAEHVLYADERWGQVEFLASADERFRPVDVAVGPDGALYVVDMYRGIIQDHVFLSAELRAQALTRGLDKPLGMGRIWRIRAQSPAALAAVVDLSNVATEDLVKRLGHANAWQRETAQRLLLARDGRSLDRQLKRAVRQGSERQAIHALWTLSGRGSLDRSTVRKALQRSEPAVHLSAVRAGHTKLKYEKLLTLANESNDPAVKQQLILALAPHNVRPAVQAYLLQELVAQAGDRYHPSAIKAAAYRQELPLLDALQKQQLWSAVLEQQTGFVKALVMQGVRANPAEAERLLNFVAAQTKSERWLQIAALNGMHEASREESFDRVTLSQAHVVFATKDQALWPAVARARRAVTWPGDELAANAKPLTPTQKSHRAKGKEYYAARCASCHGIDGKGMVSLAPPLAGSAWVTGSSERLVRIVLQGLQGPIDVAGETWNSVMPGHGSQVELTDGVASGLMTYLHRAWGHSGRVVEPNFIARVRAQTATRAQPWTVAELLSVETNTHYRRYVGRYGSPEFALEFIYNGQGLAVRSGIFNGPLAELREDYFLFEPRQLRLEFVLNDDNRVIALRMPGPDGEVVLPRM